VQFDNDSHCAGSEAVRTDAAGNFTATIALTSAVDPVLGPSRTVEISASWTDPTRAVVTETASIPIGTSANPIFVWTSILSHSPDVEFAIVASLEEEDATPSTIDTPEAASPPAPNITADVWVKLVDSSLCSKLGFCSGLFTEIDVATKQPLFPGREVVYAPNATEKELLTEGGGQLICSGIRAHHHNSVPPPSWSECRFALPDANLYAITACSSDSCSSIFRCVHRSLTLYPA
jgi:hypothetical protein